jgi:hypothetical protein
LIFIIPSGFVFLAIGPFSDRFKAMILSHCPVTEATRVELVLVKVVSTKFKGQVLQTKHTTRIVHPLQRQGDIISFEACVAFFFETFLLFF